MSRRNATFWSKVGETGVGEQGISHIYITIWLPVLDQFFIPDHLGVVKWGPSICFIPEDNYYDYHCRTSMSPSPTILPCMVKQCAILQE